MLHAVAKVGGILALFKIGLLLHTFNKRSFMKQVKETLDKIEAEDEERKSSDLQM